MNQRLTDSPIGMSARVKAAPATWPPVRASWPSRIATMRVHCFFEASISRASWKAGFLRTIAEKA